MTIDLTSIFSQPHTYDQIRELFPGIVETLESAEPNYQNDDEGPHEAGDANFLVYDVGYLTDGSFSEEELKKYSVQDTRFSRPIMISCINFTYHDEAARELFWSPAEQKFL
jgi:hypothetical protein